MTPRLLAPLLLTALSACATIPQPGGTGQRPPPRPDVQTQQPPPERPAPPPQIGFQVPQIQRVAGLERVIQRDAATLVRQFGTPRLDVREGDMRKLQFSGGPCVLDVFLYPLQQGGEPVATWVDARRSSDGQEVDRAACVKALARG